MFKYKQLAGVGLAALAATALTTSPAWAVAGIVAPAVTFAVQGVAANGNTVEIAPGVSYTGNTGAVGDGACTFNLTFTLPSGVTFGTEATPIVVGGSYTASAPASGVGSGNSVTYVITVAAGGGVGTVTFGGSGFTVNNATALGTFPGVGAFGAAGNSFNISAQAFGATAGCLDLNNPVPVKSNLAGSLNDLTYVTAAPGAFVAIDITAPSFAKLFKKGAAPASASGDIGSIALLTAGLPNALQTAPFAFTSATATVTVSGNWPNVASAFILPGSGPGAACPATVPGTAIVGSITTLTLTFTVPFPLAAGAFSEVCLLANTTGVLSPSPNLAGGALSTSATEDTTTDNAFLTGYTYNGAVALFTYSLTGGNLASGFNSFIRIVNTNPTGVTIPANVWVDGAADGSTSGTTASILLVNPLAGNGGATIQFSNILAAAGLAPPADGRAFIQLLLPVGTGATQLMNNPNNTFVNMF